MSYNKTVLHSSVAVDSIYSIHYFEYMSDFSFPGEAHDFWEFLYVDKGEVDVIAGDRLVSLKKGEIIFHRPNEFHSVRANGKTAPNLVVISFGSDSPCLDFFQHKVFSIVQEDRVLIAQIIREAKKVFSSPLNDPYLNRMEKSFPPPFGGEQLIKLYLEQMLICMIRRGISVPNGSVSSPAAKSVKQNSDQELYSRIVKYLEGNLQTRLTVDQICRDTLVGRSQLLKLFREKNGGGVIDFFLKLKIETAKQIIRENQLNFTQISERLGFSSIHYFSRQFKKITGMTPSEYASSVKNLAESSH